MKKIIPLLLILQAILFTGLYAQAPKTLSYQGKLSDAGGSLNGTYSLTFNIYDAATGGTSLWNETSSNVAVSNGFLSLTLGKITPINIETNKPLWMGISVGANLEISPRVELTGNLYSLGLALPMVGRSNSSETTVDLNNAGTGMVASFSSTNSLNTEPVIMISHAGAGNAVTANSPIQATKFIGDGSLLTGILGLNLPFSQSTSAGTIGFTITATGTSSAGKFAIENPSNNSPVLLVQTNGNGAGIYSVGNIGASGTISSTQFKAGQEAASFHLNNTTSNSNSLISQTDGVGNAIQIWVTNPANSSSGININHAGTGNAITANRPIQASKFIGDGSLLTNLPGSGWGLSGTGGTVDASNFIGTIDNVPFNIRVNNQKSGKIDPTANNAFFGYTSGRNMTSGILNTAMGGGSLSNNTTGEQNTAMGYNALGNNTTGIQNTAIGSMSLVSSITASGNTAFGNQTLVQNTTGDFNTAIGRANMVLNTTGIRNTALGSQALFSNTIGNFNTAIGFNAMYSNTVGSNNTVIGNNADVGSNNLTNATAIGYNAKVNSSNSMVLGGTGQDSVKVGIGITAPTEMLHVVGNVKAAKFIGDGSLLTNLPSSGLTLPYVGSSSSSSNSLDITKNGSVGGAGSFIINNSSNPGSALSAISSGTGTAGSFYVDNPTNTGYSLWASSNGFGSLRAENTGAGGAAQFLISNSSNTSAVINITSNGTGNAITANRPIQASKFIGDGSFLTGLPNGFSLPFTGSSNVGTNTFDITNAGASGYAGSFSITNASNSASSLFVSTFGTGNAIRALSTGGPAAYLQVLNPTSSYDALFVSTNGTGPSGNFNITNSSSTSSAIIINHAGTGNAITTNRPIQATQFIGDGSLLTNLPSSGWGLTGTSGTIDGTNFIGTIDNIPLSFRVNNQKAGRIEISNTFFGYRSGNSNTGVGNTASGSSSLQNNTSGNNNTAFGSTVLFANITGSSNTGFGSSALQANSTGTQNTAIGQSALALNTSGIQNTANGAFALNSNTTASNNTAIGYSALQLNTTGENNTATGYFALRNNTTGYSNAAYGQSALQNNTIGTNNTAIGNNALQNTTTGSQNTASGVSSLFSNNTGGNNTALGFFSLILNSTGNQNTAIGSNALQNNATGSQNTALGYNAFFSGSGFSNSTAIGYNALVTASNMIRFGDANITVIQGQVGFTAASDQRLKKDILTLTGGLDFILKLKPVSYKMKSDESGKTNWGFIAQDIEKLVGTENAMLTIGGDKDRTLGLRYTDFVAPLVKAVQEQQKVIDDLKLQNSQKDQKLKQLEASIENLKSTVSDLSSLKAELEKIKSVLGVEANNSGNKVSLKDK